MSDFKPGDRVSLTRKLGKPPYEYVVGSDQQYTASAVNRDEREVPGMWTLVSRPVYPEPGQVVIVLDESTHQALVDAAASIQGATDSVSVADRIFDALRDRAREAAR